MFKLYDIEICLWTYDFSSERFKSTNKQSELIAVDDLL